ncbi:aromatic amino acid lyase [bacterium]|nr:aromatic amino acid lyase [bacterium]
MTERDSRSDHSSFSPSVLRVMGKPVANPVVIDHSPDCLTLEKLVAVARGDDEGRVASVRVSQTSLERVARSARKIEEAILTAQENFAAASPESKHLFLIYGVNTGFGINRDKPVETFADCCKLSENILFSHATAVGPPLPSEVVRATMLLRLRTFAQGRSGVRPDLLNLLVELLNKRVHPWVPSQGSVGSSGDLCSLSHLSLVLIGEGQAWVETDYPGPDCTVSNSDVDARRQPMPGAEALAAVGLKPLTGPLAPNGFESDDAPRLAPKEGIALTNGASVAAALSALSIHDGEVLLSSANLAGAMTLQAIGGITRAFEPIVHEARRHTGQMKCAREIMSFVENPDPGGLDNRASVLFQTQDDYSVRAMPQVHGPALSAIAHARETIEAEINAVTDNPLIFCEEGDESYQPNDTRVGRPVSLFPIYSAANFHGEPVGLVSDYLKLALSELASISERRIQLLLDGKRNRGLPANLSGGRGGLDSGFMILQYTAASLVSENKVLCHPSSCDSIPTSSDAEDHVAMATTAARHLAQVVKNVSNVLAIEFICASQALAFRTEQRELLLALLGGSGSWPIPNGRKEGEPPPSVSPPCKVCMDQVFSVCPFVTADAGFRSALPHQRIQAVRDLLSSGTLLLLARNVLSPSGNLK